MMPKLQLLEDHLLKINAGVFQELCDRYFSYIDPDCKGVIRSGSMIGAQKERKGTPDAYYIRSTGLYVLLEYTTMSPIKRKPFLDKIRADIDKCVALSEEGFPLEKAECLIYCFNSRLTITEHASLITYAAEKQLRLHLYGIDELVRGLLDRTPTLARDYLGVSIDTGQVLPVKAFINAYDRSAIATPLDYTFIGREDELTGLRQTVQASKVTIVTGAPGVGKTKLVVQLLEQLSKEQVGAQVYCLQNRSVPIFDNLQDVLANGENYYFFIDDANRQVDILQQVLGLMLTKNNKNIRLVLTARDYAVASLLEYTKVAEPALIKIGALTNEQILQLLLVPELAIEDVNMQARILDIAEGNPRLAVMAAHVTAKNGSREVLDDAMVIYDAYFNHALPSAVFSDKQLLRVLGIIAFFHAIDRRYQPFLDKMLGVFGIERTLFEEKVSQLEKLELVEQSPGLYGIRIAEQVMGTYFFYLVFLRERLLDFQLILQHYLVSHQGRIRDCIIPTNSLVGFDRFTELIQPYLSTWWITGRAEEEVLVFFNLFWIHRQETALWYIHERTKQLAGQAEIEFRYDKEKAGRASYPLQPYLQLLYNFYREPLPSIDNALDLGLAYICRRPGLYTEYAHNLQHIFSAGGEDFDTDYYRQRRLLNFLERATKKLAGKNGAALICDIAPALLRTTFNLSLREQLFQLIESVLPYDKVAVFRLLVQCIAKELRHVDKAVLQKDFPAMLGIISRHWSDADFAGAYLVFAISEHCKRMKLGFPLLDTLKEKYYNTAYSYYLLLSYDEYRDRKGGRRFDWKRYEKEKMEEIRQKINLIPELESFKVFYAEIVDIHLTLALISEKDPIRFGLDILLGAAFEEDLTKTTFLEHIAQTGNATGYVPYRPLEVLRADADAYNKFADFLCDRIFFRADWWMINWYALLPNERLTKELVLSFIDIVIGSTDLGTVSFDQKEAYEVCMPNFYQELLGAVFVRNKQSELTPIALFDQLKEHLNKFTADINLVKQSYLQQGQSADYFDYNFELFFEVVQIDETFFLTYLQTHFSQGGYVNISPFRNIVKIWRYPFAERLVTVALDFLADHAPVYVDEEQYQLYFLDTASVDVAARIDFIKRYLGQHIADKKRVRAIFDCVRGCFPEQLPDVLEFFLQRQPDIVIFETIRWSSQIFVGNSGAILGEMRAKDYEKVLAVLKGMEQSFRYALHIELIQRCIASERRSAENERISRFFDRD